jgi:DNA primase
MMAVLTYPRIKSKPNLNLVQEVKGRIAPANFYRAELPTMPAPRGGGWRDGGLCPFHDDQHAGSFRVKLDTGSFKCFACGANGGDIIAFTQLRDGLSFPEALQKLSSEWGLS